MLRTLTCPHCSADLAYSAALLGRTVRCHHCRTDFPVQTPPGPAHSNLPPPLPRRSPRSTDRTRLDDPDDREDSRRTAGPAALLGLLGVYVAGFSLVAGGLALMLWPAPSVPTVPTGPRPVLVGEDPVAVEPPRGLQDILKDAPKAGKK